MTTTASNSRPLPKLSKCVYIGRSPAGIAWWAYAGRHTQKDVEIMRTRLDALHARHERKAAKRAAKQAERVALARAEASVPRTFKSSWRR